MTTRRDILRLALAAPLLSACGGGDSSSRGERPIPTPIPADDWPTATPESQGVAAPIMLSLLDSGIAIPHLFSLLVVRNGQLIGERYYRGAQSSDLRSLASVTKTVSSLLIGQALNDRKISSTADTLRTLLPTEIARTSNAFAADITLQQVLDMRGGQKWDESIRQRDATTAPDMTAFALALPSDGAERGTKFEYNTATSGLLSPILSSAYQMDELAVATRNLFQPMGIKQTAWSRDASGMIHGSFGLQMRTRDLMKLAWMSLDGGRWQGRSVVPASWLAENLQPHVTGLGDDGRLRQMGYGNLWWHGMLGGHRVVLAWGYGGQHALLVPGLNMTIATACELNVSFAQADENQGIILELIARFLQAIPPV